MNAQHFPFAFDRWAGALLKLIGVKPDRAWVSLTRDRLSVHFGPLPLTTKLENFSTCG